MAINDSTKASDEEESDEKWDPVGELTKLLARETPLTKEEVNNVLTSLDVQFEAVTACEDYTGLVQFGRGLFGALHLEESVMDRDYLVVASRTMNVIVANMANRPRRSHEQDEWARSDPAIMAIIDVLCSTMLMKTSTLAGILKRKVGLSRQIDRMEVGDLISCEYAAPRTRYVRLTPAGQSLQDARPVSQPRRQQTRPVWPEASGSSLSNKRRGTGRVLIYQQIRKIPDSRPDPFSHLWITS